MKTIKGILIVLAVIVALVVLIGFLLPKRVYIEQALVIKAHPGLIFNQVNTTMNWEAWSPWHKIDSAMKITYSGPSMGKDACYSWESDMKKLGKGKLTITKSIPFDTISIETVLMDQAPAIGQFLFKAVEEGTEVKWTLESALGNNPIHRYYGLLMKTYVGKYLSTGLKNIQRIVESNQNPKLEIKNDTVAEMNYLFIRETVPLDKIGQKMGEFYNEIAGYMQSKDKQPAGYPFSLYYEFDNQVFDLAAGMPTSEPMKGEGRIQSDKIYAGKVLVIDYYGSYEGTEIPHLILDKFVKANHLVMRGRPWEAYVTDPMSEKDSNKWLTKVYYPIQ